MFGVCIFYVFNSIESQKAMMRVSETQNMMMKNLSQLIGFISFFISIVMGFLILYANKFLIRRRKKELGIYMTLGMDKMKISMVLVIETFIIGLCSLAVGLSLGVLLSQGLSIFTAKLFEADMTEFKFIFSQSSFLKSILCFGIIYAIVMIFNVFSISKCKLIDLIYGDKKNEELKVKKLWISVVIFIISVGSLAFSYYLIIDNGLRDLDKQFYGALLFAFIGTFLFFMSLSGFLLKVIQCSKSLYFRNLNMFVLRQINSKINTTYISMTFICLMLAVTIVALSSGMAVKQSMGAELRELAPYDASMIWEYNPKLETITSVSDELRKRGVDAEKYSRDLAEIKLYNTDISFVTIFDGQSVENSPYYISNLINKKLRAISLSDYNKALKMQGEDPITLDKNQFAINCNVPELQDYFLNYLKKYKTLNYNNTLLEAKFEKPLEYVYHVCIMKEDTGTIIIPDEIVDKASLNSIVLNMNYLEPEVEKKLISNVETLMEKQKKQEIQIYGLTKEIVYDSNIGLSAIMTFLTVYISIVFLLTSAAVLALQQLTEASDNKSRYNLLSKLGADRSMTNKALFIQIAIYFTVPLILAIIHGIVGISVANNVIVVFGKINVLPTIIFTTCIFIIIYGGYFLSTYFSSKNIVNR